MAKQGRIGLGGRKGLPSKHQAKRLRKVSASTNVEKAMVVSTKRRGHQPKRALRPKRGIDREKLRRLARERTAASVGSRSSGGTTRDRWDTSSGFTSSRGGWGTPGCSTWRG